MVFWLFCNFSEWQMNQTKRLDKHINATPLKVSPEWSQQFVEASEIELVCREHGTLIATVKQDALSTNYNPSPLHLSNNPLTFRVAECLPVTYISILTMTIARAISILARRKALKAVCDSWLHSISTSENDNKNRIFLVTTSTTLTI